LKKLFHGTQYVPGQICKFYSRLRYVRRNANVFDSEDTDPSVFNAFTKIMNQCKVKSCINYDNDLKVFGNPLPSKMTNIQLVLIEQSVGRTVNENCKIFHKFIYKNVVFHSNSYKRLRNRNNNTVMMNHGDNLFITGLFQLKLTDINEELYFVIGNIFVNMSETMLCQGEFDARIHSKIVIPTNNSACRELREIQRKCVNLPYIHNRRCITSSISRLETD